MPFLLFFATPVFSFLYLGSLRFFIFIGFAYSFFSNSVPRWGIKLFKRLGVSESKKWVHLYRRVCLTKHIFLAG